MFGGGAGIVALKRLDDALRDGATVHAVILASAINNDGAAKVGFAAPSVAGQAKVVRAAHRRAGVHPSTIGYVEAHGTGTELGDPVEVAALTEAFRAGTDERGFCALGSGKGHVGHLDAAAGIAGLIRTVMALRARELPPTLHYQAPNPALELSASPFFVSDEPRPWEPRAGVRRAGVSSFGVGGTNAHVVLQEAPDTPAPAPSGEWQALVLSARPPEALEQAAERRTCARTRSRRWRTWRGSWRRAGGRWSTAAWWSAAHTRKAPRSWTPPPRPRARRTARRPWHSVFPVRGRSTPGWAAGCTTRSPSTGQRWTAAPRSSSRCWG